MKAVIHQLNAQPAAAPAIPYLDVPIMLVDDNAAMRVALKSLLSPLGYRVVEADSGVAALRAAIAQDFAVILMDVRMPTMNGFETVRRLRQRRQAELTPIIFITAHGKEEMADLVAYATGAADFIFSPVPAAELQAKVSVFANLYLRAEVLAAQAQEVQKLADQLTLLTDVAPVGIFRTDADNNYVYVNPRWSEITGVAFEDAIGHPWDFIKNPEQPPEDGETADGVIPDPPFTRPFEIRHRDGVVARIVMGMAKPLVDRDDATTGWVGILSDVTADAAAKAAMVIAHNAALLASETDPLTRLSNRRRLEGDLVVECDRSVRYRRPLSFVMLDADNFKDFNDDFGHQAGDEVLREFAGVFAATLRASDTAYRYGGEEFCLLLRETTTPEAMVVAERIRSQLEQLSGDDRRAVTASFGVASLAVRGGTSEDLIAAADRALYAAKRAGRNRVLLSTTAQPAADEGDADPARVRPQIVRSVG